MVIFLSFLIIIFIILLFLMFTPMEVRLIINHSQEEDQVLVELGLLWGLAKFKLSIKSLELGLNKVVGIFHVEGKAGSGGSDDHVSANVSLEQLLQIIKNIDLNLFKHLLHFTQRVIPPIKEIKLTWITKFGTQDAAVTGLVSGLLWSLKGGLITILNGLVKDKMKHSKLEVVPVFNAQVFSLLIDCIFKFTIGHIIIAGIKLAILVLMFKIEHKIKGGEFGGRSSNRNANENSYGKY